MGYEFPKYEGRPGVVHMKDLFEMTAGTSTGSIISAGLSFPKGNSTNFPKYFADDVIEIYTKNGDKIFSKSEGSELWVQVVIFIIHVLIWGVVFFFIGRHRYDNP